MPCKHRGLITPAIITSTIVLVLCSIGWGAVGVASLVDPNGMPNADHRFLCIFLATVTICSTIVHLSARVLRDILAAIAGNLAAISSVEGSHAEGYAEGYTDGLSAAPVSPAPVTRLVRSPR